MNSKELLNKIKNISRQIDINVSVNNHSEVVKLLEEFKRLLKLQLEVEVAIEKHDNKIGNYLSKRMFDKPIKECKIRELMELGVMFDNVYRADIEEDLR